MTSFATQRQGSSAPDLFRRFLPYLSTARRAALLSAAFVLLEPLVTVSLLWTGKVFVDDVLVAGRFDLVLVCGGVLAVLLAAKLGLDYLTVTTEARVVQAITQALRTDLFGHVLSLSPGSLEAEGTGSLLSRLQGDTEQTEYLVYTAPLAILADAAAALFFTAALFVLSWPLALVTLLALPGIVWSSYRLAPAIRKAARQTRRAEALWMSHAEERLEAAPMVQAFTAEISETQKFSARAGRARDREVAAQKLMAWQGLLIEAAAAAGGLAVLVAGAYLISAGALTVGALVAFIGAIGSAYGPVRALAKAVGRIHHAAAGAQRVAEILDRPSLIADRPGAQPLARPDGAIEFSGIAFSYPDGEPVLGGVSFRIEPGETVALVGASGSGKSSLIRLLLRFYEPSAGQILIGGEDIRNITLSSLRSTIAAVFQEPSIFSGSLASNVRFGASGYPADRIAGAARAAAVDRFVDIPAGGLAGAAGPRGSLLSGGQRQRIALARALVKSAPILVLDEATGAVDSETEAAIQDALSGERSARTTLIVAHRLSSVIRADRVIVLEEGRIVESGTPAELFAGATRARALFSAQNGSVKEAA